MENDNKDVQVSELEQLQAELLASQQREAETKKQADEYAKRISQAEHELELTKSKQEDKILTTITETIKAQNQINSEQERAEAIENELRKLDKQQEEAVRAEMSKLNITDPVELVNSAKILALQKKGVSPADIARAMEPRYSVQNNPAGGASDRQPLTPSGKTNYGKYESKIVDALPQLLQKIASNNQIKFNSKIDTLVDRVKGKLSA